MALLCKKVVIQVMLVLKFLCIFQMKTQHLKIILRNSWTSEYLIKDSNMKNNAIGERLCLNIGAGYVYRML